MVDSMIKDELAYLLHLRYKSQKYVRVQPSSSLTTIINNLVSKPDDFEFNEKVMVVLVESGLLQNEFRDMNPGDYALFLKYLLD